MTETKKEVFKTCEDHSVSGENFQLIWNKQKDILITSPQPSAEKLPEYYQSEDYISHTDASKSVSDKLYQGVKSYMLQKKVKLMNSLAKNSTKNLLDIGAGTGDFLLVAKKKNWKVEGIEPNKKARDLAQEKGLSLYENVDELSENKFNVISMWHVLEHVPNLDEQIKNIYTLLEEDGFAIIAVPNFKSYDANYYKEFWAAYDVPRHLWHFSQTGMERIFKEHNFQLIKTLPLPFDAYYVSLLSEKYKNGKSNLLKSFQVGLRSNMKAKSTSEYSSLVYVFQKQ